MSEALTTLAANRYRLTSFFDSEALEVAKNNTQALVLGLTGVALTTDLVVSEGHQHITANDRIKWRQLVTFPLSCGGAGGIGVAPNEGWDAVQIDTTGFVALASLRLFISAVDAALLVMRIRISNDNSIVVTFSIKFEFYQLDLTTLVLSTTVTGSTITLRDRVWVEFAAIDVSAAAADTDWPDRLPLVVLISGKLSAATEFVALHEVAFGVTP